jgi:broad specificity phosphatase PhoE
MKQLYLIRHGETKELAGEESPHPRNDSQLSLKGLEQIESLKEYLRPMPINLFLTSVFQRSQQTADLLNLERKVPVFSSLALNEFFLRDDFEGVETTEQGLVRSLGFLNQFRAHFDDIAIIGHNSILSAILMSLLNMPFSQGKDSFSQPGTCRILRYDWTQGDENWQEPELFTP